ncbi:PadR family transcriptional regulator [Caulobacter sp. KR2-114]|uniref:PadR family transcriptional regulator n=1 Tax=Caulobacter sp. KR2-114 TaxID=3400912 RepID=UPI003C0F6CDC
MVEAVQVQLKKGVLELCVLALLSRADSYAYEIASRLAEGIDMGEGTIYPLMRRMQDDGLVETYLVESTAGPSRKYYRLTEAGRRSFASQKDAWVQFVGAVNAILGDAANLGAPPAGDAAPSQDAASLGDRA